MRALGYEGATSLGASEVAALVALPERVLRRFPLAGSAVQIPPRQGFVALDTPSFIAKVHALGLLLHYWTIDDPTEALRLLRAGADGIMTNEPRRLAPLGATFGAEAR